MREAVIISAVRTPAGRANKGAYKDIRPEDLGAAAIIGAMSKVPGLKPSDVEDVILGCAMPEGTQGLNLARTVAMLAGLPTSVPGQTVNRFCSSGLQTIATAAERIIAFTHRIARFNWSARRDLIGSAHWDCGLE